MNASRRKRLREALNWIDDANRVIEEVRDEEQESYDNLPEGVQGSDRGDAMSEAVNTLDNAATALQDMTTEIEEIIDA